MQLEVIDNQFKSMASALCEAMELSKDIRIAVAFVSTSGLRLIERSLEAALRAQAYVEFSVGLDLRCTEADAVHKLYSLSQENPRASVYCYASLQPSSIYHPKLYLFQPPGEGIAIIGSSNLTQGGLKTNVELNLALRANLDDEAISDIYSAYNRLKFHRNRVVPDEEFLALYAEMRDRERRRDEASRRDLELQGLARAFKEKADSLPHPIPVTRDLVGWQRLVYDALPQGEFKNKDLYKHEDDFQQRYPENRHIPDKIRQQLQELRDMGLIEHLGPARWRKV